MADVLTAPDEQITGPIVFTGEDPDAADPQQAEVQEPVSEEAAPQQAAQAADDDDFDVVLEEPKVDGDVAIDPNAKDYSHVDQKITNKDIQRRIAQLTAEKHIKDRQVEALQRNLNASIAAGNALANKLKLMSGETHAVSKSAVMIAQEKTKTDVEQAKRQYAEARANGDVDKETAATEALNRALMEHSKVSEVVLPEEPQTPEEVQYYEQLQHQLRQVPVVLPEPFLQWKEANPWYGAQNDARTAHLTGLANQISATIADEGIAVDSAEHFAELNARLRAAAPKIFGEAPQTRQQQTSPAVPKAPPVVRHQPVAPVGTRTAPTAKRTVTYTPEEARWAKEFGMDIKDIIRGRQGVQID